MRKFILGASALVLAVVIGFLLNFRGWRALITTRLLRVGNFPVVVPRPPSSQPLVPRGFQVSIFAAGFESPRWLAVAPNGDVFVADSGTGQVLVLSDPSRTGKAESRVIFADHLTLPFGVAFHESYVYVANTNAVMRFKYDPSTSKRLGNAQHVLDLPGFGYNQHWTRSLLFSKDGKHLFISVGSRANVGIESDLRRAAILIADPDGSSVRVFASGMRNPVGMALNPETGFLWATVNERDNSGDDIPPDYFTHVTEGGFYGWPYSYIGSHVDNRVPSRPDLVAKAIVPDVLLDAHSSPLQFAFYDGQQFPLAYRHGAFIAEHGSHNRHIRSGYQVVFIPFENGRPTGEAQTFLTGFVPDSLGKNVYGRPVGLAIQPDGSLLVSDDGAKVIWRISFETASGGGRARRLRDQLMPCDGHGQSH
jgi:glucose/arabinose dehydrogenase